MELRRRDEMAAPRLTAGPTLRAFEWCTVVHRWCTAVGGAGATLLVLYHHSSVIFTRLASVLVGCEHLHSLLVVDLMLRS